MKFCVKTNSQHPHHSYPCWWLIIIIGVTQPSNFGHNGNEWLHKPWTAFCHIQEWSCELNWYVLPLVGSDNMLAWYFWLAYHFKYSAHIIQDITTYWYHWRFLFKFPKKYVLKCHVEMYIFLRNQFGIVLWHFQLQSRCHTKISLFFWCNSNSVAQPSIYILYGIYHTLVFMAALLPTKYRIWGAIMSRGIVI